MKHEEVYYCKQLLKTNKPIVVKNLDTGKQHTTNIWRRVVYDEDGSAWIEEMKYTPGKKDKSGARVKFTRRRKKK